MAQPKTDAAAMPPGFMWLSTWLASAVGDADAAEEAIVEDAVEDEGIVEEAIVEVETVDMAAEEAVAGEEAAGKELGRADGGIDGSLFTMFMSLGDGTREYRQAGENFLCPTDDELRLLGS